MLSWPLANEMSSLLFKGGHSFQLFCSGDICAHFLDYFNSLRVTVQTKHLNFTPIYTVSSWAFWPLSPSLCVLLLDTYTYVLACICYIFINNLFSEYIFQNFWYSLAINIIKYFFLIWILSFTSEQCFLQVDFSNVLKNTCSFYLA